MGSSNRETGDAWEGNGDAWEGNGESRRRLEPWRPSGGKDRGGGHSECHPRLGTGGLSSGWTHGGDTTPPTSLFHHLQTHCAATTCPFCVHSLSPPCPHPPCPPRESPNVPSVHLLSPQCPLRVPPCVSPLCVPALFTGVSPPRVPQCPPRALQCPPMFPHVIPVCPCCESLHVPPCESLDVPPCPLVFPLCPPVPLP